MTLTLCSLFSLSYEWVTHPHHTQSHNYTVIPLTLIRRGTPYWQSRMHGSSTCRQAHGFTWRKVWPQPSISYAHTCVQLIKPHIVTHHIPEDMPILAWVLTVTPLSFDLSFDFFSPAFFPHRQLLPENVIQPWYPWTRGTGVGQCRTVHGKHTHTHTRMHTHTHTQLTATETMNYDDAFTLESVSDELVDKFNHVAGIVPVLTTHIGKVITWPCSHTWDICISVRLCL